MGAVSDGGGNSGLAQPGDNFTLSYDEGIDGISVLSNWVWPWPNTNDVRITLVDGGAGNDSLSVTTANGSTTLPFGTFTFNAGTYVTGGNAIFGGTGATTASTLSRSANGQSFTLTLGSRNGGPGTVVDINGNNRLTWVPAPVGATGVYDAAGNRIAAAGSQQSGNTTQF
jgi:hypothetical protein